MLGKITCRLEKPATLKNKSDWDHFTWNFANLAEQQREDTLRIRHEGRSIRNETGIQARWDNYRNNNRIRDRITEIDNWRVALEQTVCTIDLEIRKQDAAKEAVEQSVETKVIDLDIVNEIMSIREQRRGNDYVMDEAQQELIKESCIIKETRNALEKKGQESWHQIARLQEVRQLILRDLNEKVISVDIDRYLLGLTETSSEIAFRPDPLRIPKGMMTPQAWEEQSRYNKLRADCELANSMKLREAMLLTIDQTLNELKAQREVTDFHLRKRFHEYHKTTADLCHQKDKILKEMCKVETEIRDMEDALLDKSNKLKLAETRLEHRTYRFGVELTRDDAQYGLTQEVLQLRAAQKVLQNKIDENKKSLNMLLGFLQNMEGEMENKNEAKVIEQQALDVRGRVAASQDTPLTKTDRNIALSATVPVPEDRRRQTGETGRPKCHH
ncbi:unnamed protein product [Allacma fusca]|uniref:Tektin n=1 Tax=Allacma fusca TaxID=39272 RepID=A0A8J2PVN5_9HEXA|nr:unnamed protein product [Allacma fusca]